MYIQRVHEWKECFQAMFRKWIHQVIHYKLERKSIPLSNICFYSLCPGQVVLFKGYNSSSLEGPPATPLIVLSSTTTQTRHTLLSMGIQLRVLNEMDLTLDILSLDMLHDLEKKSPSIRGNTEQDGGSKQGNVRQSNLEHTRKRSVPMYILGTRDCLRYYEYFLNTLGSQLSCHAFPLGHTHTPKRVCDVPLLLCRSLGPCRHTTLKTLSSFVRIRVDDTNTANHHESCEFRGPIMPCAVKEMLSATAHALVLDSKNGSIKSKNIQKERNNNIGSHYFVAHLQCHQGEEVKESVKESIKSNRMGLNGLLLANDGMDSLQEDTTNSICRRGDYLSTAVWDITRPSSIMCKRDKTEPV